MFKQSDQIPEEQRTAIVGVEIKTHIIPCNMVTTHSAEVLPEELVNVSVNECPDHQSNQGINNMLDLSSSNFIVDC